MGSLYIGLMSGTSMDGVDVVLFDVDKYEVLAANTYKYSQKARLELIKLNTKPLLWEDVYIANKILGEEFAHCVNSLLSTSKYTAKDIIAIGNHGQTIAHDTNALVPYTLQIACSHTIAQRTGISVVSDFRTRDLILGGKGAPFAPIFHEKIFAMQEKPIAVINIGGISNISYINDNITYGYDIGPGNCLLDQWIYKHKQVHYDADGAWALSGKPIPQLLERLLQDDFFKIREPKSIGKEYFSIQWLTKYLQNNENTQDIQATLLALTVELLVQAILNSDAKNIFICGGGVHNIALMQKLQESLDKFNIKSTQDLGINPDYIEASMCAWLAYACINKIPVDFTKITGSTHSSIYGVIYPSLANF